MFRIFLKDFEHPLTTGESYIDLYRAQDDKIVEHWGFPEMVPPQGEWKNNNGML